MNRSLRQFTETMAPAVAQGLPDEDIATEAERALRVLLAGDDILTEEQCRPDPRRYAQHVLYVHPAGAYSIVSLVWLPGQHTPIHDHVCWCVTGVLRGREEEARYTLHDSGLTVSDVVVNGHGDVSRLVPPAENIHRVTNACDGVAISLHVYGADIAARGTSVNQVFDHAVTASAGGAPRSWRSTGELPRHQGVDVDPAGITIAPHPSSTPERPSERAAARQDGHARGE